MKIASFLLFMWMVQFTVAASAESQRDNNIQVNVQVDGENVLVDLTLTVSATRQQVWAVLTDFEHMAGFISNLKESKVISNSGGAVHVFQRGLASYGPLDFAFESTRELLLTPYDKIQSHMISGNMRKMEGLTLLRDEGEKTRIVYHTDSIPGVWIPPVVGKSFIEHQVREQFQEMLDEILKRKQAISPVSLK